MHQTKIDFLESKGLLNPKPETVKHPEFQNLDFFDPLDLPQVRYEMLRTARTENDSVAEACRQFGFSREYFYQLERVFYEHGYAALLGSRTGRRPILALDQEIITFIVHRKIEIPVISGERLREEILQRFKVSCSCRTVERIVEKLGFGKKGLHKPT